MSTRRAEALWIDTRHRWQINVQREGQRKTFTCSTEGRKGKHECEAKADKWLETFDVEQKFSTALDAFLADKAQKVSAGTYKSQSSIIEKWLRPAFAPGKKLSSITAYDWQKVLDTLIAYGVTKLYAKQVEGYIRTFIGYCINRGWNIRDVKASQLDAERGCKAAKVKKALTREQLTALLTADPEKYHAVALFQFCVMTGLRKGEALALRWDDISDGVLHIRRTIYGHEERKGKTDNALRTVPLQQSAIDLLNRHKARLISIGRLNVAIFPNEHTGCLLEYNSLNYMWSKIADGLGLDGITIHELRHTFISVVQGDMPEALLKQAVGHSATMDTYGIYGHQTARDISQSQGIIDNAFAEYLK